MNSYLRSPFFDQSKHYALNKTIFMDDRLMEDKRGGRDVGVLYSAFKDTFSLSQSTENKEYMDAQGNYYCVYEQKRAEYELRIKRTKYNQHKSLLKDAGLIQLSRAKAKERRRSF